MFLSEKLDLPDGPMVTKSDFYNGILLKMRDIKNKNLTSIYLQGVYPYVLPLLLSRPFLPKIEVVSIKPKLLSKYSDKMFII